MRTMLFAVVVAALCLPLTTKAGDDSSRDGSFYLTPMISHVLTDDKRGIDDGFGFHGAIGLPLRNDWAVEFGVTHHRLNSPTTDVELRSFGVDLVKSFGHGQLRPFLIGGLGLVDVDVPDTKSIGGNIGGGVLYELDRVMLRGEFRYRYEFDSPQANDVLLNFGVQVPLGGG